MNDSRRLASQHWRRRTARRWFDLRDPYWFGTVWIWWQGEDCRGFVHYCTRHNTVRIAWWVWRNAVSNCFNRQRHQYFPCAQRTPVW